MSSSFFDRLKTAVGLATPKKGHVLGQGVVKIEDKYEYTENIHKDGDEFTVRFDREVLGFSATSDDDGLPIVVGVQDPQLRQKMRQNDVIVAVDGEDVLSFESFMEVIQALGRPVFIR